MHSVKNDTIGDFVAFWKKIYNFKGNYHYIIEKFDLRNYIETPISFLSFGQKKKLSFVRLLMMKTKNLAFR